jgi:hypothetical protein
MRQVLLHKATSRQEFEPSGIGEQQPPDVDKNIHREPFTP